jgi:hypothetical protein
LLLVEEQMEPTRVAESEAEELEDLEPLFLVEQKLKLNLVHL